MTASSPKRFRMLRSVSISISAIAAPPTIGFVIDSTVALPSLNTEIGPCLPLLCSDVGSSHASCINNFPETNKVDSYKFI